MLTFHPPDSKDGTPEASVKERSSPPQVQHKWAQLWSCKYGIINAFKKYTYTVPGSNFQDDGPVKHVPIPVDTHARCVLKHFLVVRETCFQEETTKYSSLADWLQKWCPSSHWKELGTQNLDSRMSRVILEAAEPRS